MAGIDEIEVVAPSCLSDGERGSKSDCFELRRSDAPTDVLEGHDDIEIVVTHIKRLVRSAKLEFALRVGAIIIHYFYNGDTGAWRSRGAKTSSFRRLAQHPQLPLSAGALCRCVAIFELCDRLNAPSRWEYLGASHLRLVLGLAPGSQERILALANAKRWTVKTLHREVLREKALRVNAGGGRRAEPPIAKSLKAVKVSLEAHVALVQEVESPSYADIEKSIQLIEETKRCLEHLSKLLQPGGGGGPFSGGELPRRKMRCTDQVDSTMR